MHGRQVQLPKPACQQQRVRIRRRATGKLCVAAAGGVLPPGDEGPLRRWLASQGGSLHDALRLVDAAPCGARGLVAGAPISLADLDACGPLVVCSLGVGDGCRAQARARVAHWHQWYQEGRPSGLGAVWRQGPARRRSARIAGPTPHEAGAPHHTRVPPLTREQVVPKALHLESATARRLLTEWGGDGFAADAAEALGDAMLVAVALAHEMARGSASMWAPYLESLPHAPPGPWMLRGAELRAAAAAALAAHAPTSGLGATGGGGGGGGSGMGGGGVDTWVAAAEARGQATRAAVERACQQLAPAAAAAWRSSGGDRGSDSSVGSGDGPHAPTTSWLTPDALLRALGHVQSRSLGTPGSSGLGERRQCMTPALTTAGKPLASLSRRPAVRYGAMWL